MRYQNKFSEAEALVLLATRHLGCHSLQLRVPHPGRIFFLSEDLFTSTNFYRDTTGETIGLDTMLFEYNPLRTTDLHRYPKKYPDGLKILLDQSFAEANTIGFVTISQSVRNFLIRKGFVPRLKGAEITRNELHHLEDYLHLPIEELEVLISVDDFRTCYTLK